MNSLVVGFLDPRIIVGAAAICWTLITPLPTRAADEDIPPAGRSLFDIVTTVQSPDGARLAVPFPFERLRALIMTAGGLSDGDVAETLLPVGRSLQRGAAAPDFFASPRHVFGVTGEPRDADPASTLIMRDRLYLGYQPKSETLEVISFNEEAGRFEFQVVEDYAPDKKPRVVQARRPLCLSCHQNAGPIFSDPPWSETPANARVAARLAAAAGMPMPGTERIAAYRRSAQNLHRSVGAANRLLHASRFWSRLCSAPNTARHCKVNVLSTVLEHRLSGRRSFGQADFLTRRESEIFLEEAQRYSWPNGFEIAAPFIGDIDPTTPAGHKARVAGDPLNHRSALRVLDVALPDANNRIIALLGDFFSDADIRWLEKALLDMAEGVGAPRRVVRVPCDFAPRENSTNGDVLDTEFTCLDRVPGSPKMTGRLVAGPSDQKGVMVDNLSIELLEYRALSTSRYNLMSQKAGVLSSTVAPTDPASGLRPRTGDGWSIGSVELSKAEPGDAGGEAVFTIVNDIKRFRTTMGTLSGYRLPGSERAITEGNLRRPALMRALAIRLGRPAPDWCCGPATDLPPPIGAAETARLTIAGLSMSPGPAHPSLQAFHRVCGACHAGRAAAPPNFLFGSSDRQIRAIAGCAPRILARLAQWETKTPHLPPMPPPAQLARNGATREGWVASADYRRIQRFTSALGGDATTRSTRDGETAPACAPSQSKN